MCGGFPPLQPNLQLSGYQQLPYISIQFWLPTTWSLHRHCRLRVLNIRCQLKILDDSHIIQPATNWWFRWLPPWVWYLLECSQHSGKTIYLLLSIYYEDYSSGIASEELHRTRQGMRAHKASVAFLGAPFSQHLNVLTTLEAPRAQLFRDFMEIPLHRHNWWNHWPLVIVSVPAPLPSLEISGIENCNPLNLPVSF